MRIKHQTARRSDRFGGQLCLSIQLIKPNKNTVADLAGHGDTSFLERTYFYPQMQLKQEAAKRMSNSLFATPNPEVLVS